MAHTWFYMLLTGGRRLLLLCVLLLLLLVPGDLALLCHRLLRVVVEREVDALGVTGGGGCRRVLG